MFMLKFMYYCEQSSDFIPCEQVILFAWSISTEYFFNILCLFFLMEF